MLWRPAFALVVGAVVITPGATWAADLELPAPGKQDSAELCAVLGCLPDRLKTSAVPGDVDNTEVVLVGMDGAGRPARVQVEQRLVLSGSGDYVVRERGPARAATALVDGEDPPITKFGAVVWQGFTPGARRLGALLTLDPELEQARLPLSVSISFHSADGGPARALDPGGLVPAAGSVVLRIENRTTQPAELPAARDAAASDLAGPLDRARGHAVAPAADRLPTSGGALPASIRVSGPGRVVSTSNVPLRVTGRLSVAGDAGGLRGPGTSADGDISGTLASGAVEIVRPVKGPGRLDLALDVVPVLDPRSLQPPGGAASWQAWALTRPDPTARRAALDLLIQVAATGARAASYSPYLGADLPGTGTTTYRYAFAPSDPTAIRPLALTPQKGPIALVVLAFFLLVGNAALIWRQS